MVLKKIEENISNKWQHTCSNWKKKETVKHEYGKFDTHSKHIYMYMTIFYMNVCVPILLVSLYDKKIYSSTTKKQIKK